MKIRFLKEVTVGRKVYRPGDEARASLARGAFWIRSSGFQTGRRLKEDEFELVIEQIQFDELLKGEKE